jgi:transmembrane sensor
MIPASDNHVRPQTASDWLIVLSDDPDNRVLRAQFDTWLANSEQNKRDWSEVAHTAAVARHAAPQTAAVWSEFAASRATSRRTVGIVRRNARIGLAVGVMAMAAMLAVFVLPSVLVRVQADHVAETGKVLPVPLADGSVVSLSPRSAVSVSYKEGQRKVRLLRGEAFFDVSPDPNRPFVVQAGKSETTVLGTAFDVRLLGAGAEIAVEHGLVQVVLGSDKRRLGAGDWLRLNGSAAPTSGRVNPESARAWVEGQLIARDERVGDVVERLRPYFGGLIVVRGNLASQTLTGVFNPSDPEAALKSIASALKADVIRMTPWVLVISKS